MARMGDIRCTGGNGDGARSFVSHSEKVWKTLMSIAPPRQKGEKVREDLNGYYV